MDVDARIVKRLKAEIVRYERAIADMSASGNWVLPEPYLRSVLLDKQKALVSAENRLGDSNP